MNASEMLQQALRRQMAGQLAEAEELYRQVLLQHPDHPDALHLLGVLANQVGKFRDGFDLISRVVARHPEPEFLLNLGTSLTGLDRVEEAAAVYRKVVALKPDYAKGHYNLGNALHKLGQTHEAIGAYRRAIALKPDDAEAHWNLSLDLLAAGDYENGWKEYEWRWQVKGLRLGPNPPGARWDGSDLGGKTILLIGEQGFGDVLQFVRYVPLVAQKHGRISLICDRSLHRLLKCLPEIESWFAPGELLPQHDFVCPLMSLPRIFGTTLSNIPASIPYLNVEEEWKQAWLARMPGGKKKIGLVTTKYKTGTGFKEPDAARSLSVEAISGFGAVDNLWFCSLQKGTRLEVPGTMQISDWTSELGDFADTAALVDCLDLVICIDTAVAHVAGALGKPVWLLLRHLPDWQWMYGRSDSPWYPTMRIFRQPVAEDWQTPMQQVADALVE